MIKKGFTLAEILITLALAGIVATITIPPVVKNIQNHAFASAKSNSLLKITEATKEMKSEGVLSGYTTNESFINEFKKYMSVVKTCTGSNLSDCFISTFKNTDGEEINTSSLTSGTSLHPDNVSGNTIGMILKNGTSILFSLKDPEKAEAGCDWISPYDNTKDTNGCLSFLYDINGFAPPNVVGKGIGVKS